MSNNHKNNLLKRFAYFTAGVTGRGVEGYDKVMAALRSLDANATVSIATVTSDKTLSYRVYFGVNPSPGTERVKTNVNAAEAAAYLASEKGDGKGVKYVSEESIRISLDEENVRQAFQDIVMGLAVSKGGTDRKNEAENELIEYFSAELGVTKVFDADALMLVARGLTNKKASDIDTDDRTRALVLLRKGDVGARKILLDKGYSAESINSVTEFYLVRSEREDDDGTKHIYSLRHFKEDPTIQKGDGKVVYIKEGTSGVVIHNPNPKATSKSSTGVRISGHAAAERKPDDVLVASKQFLLQKGFTEATLAKMGPNVIKEQAKSLGFNPQPVNNS
jgi:hypothetical protein